MRTEIFDSCQAFRDREDKRVNGVSPEFAAKHPDFEQDNKTNWGCWNCLSCERCKQCGNCFNCTSCSVCDDCRNLTNFKKAKGLHYNYDSKQLERIQ